MNLTNLKKGETATIKEIKSSCDPIIKQRLLDLGFIPGAEITPQFASPFKDPIAYTIHQTLISLRNKDAKQVRINLKTDIKNDE